MKRPRFAVRDVDGMNWTVGRYRRGRQRHVGALWLALWECRLLRKEDPGARVVRIK